MCNEYLVSVCVYLGAWWLIQVMSALCVNVCVLLGRCSPVCVRQTYAVYHGLCMFYVYLCVVFAFWESCNTTHYHRLCCAGVVRGLLVEGCRACYTFTM